MANLIILDTGYPNTTTAGTQITASSRANSGVRVPLFSVTVDYSRGINADDSPYPAQYSDDAKVNPSSISNPKITIKGTIGQYDKMDLDNGGTLNDDQIDLIPVLDKMCKTPYTKCLYYSKIISTESYTESTDGYRGLIKSLGASNVGGAFDSLLQTAGADANTPYINVICNSFKVTESGDSKRLSWTLTCQVTG